MIKRLLVSMTAVAVLAFAAAPAIAGDALPNTLVYPLDPTLDLTSTRSDWEEPFLNTDCAHPQKPVIHAPLPVTPFTVEEVIAWAREAGRYIPPAGKNEVGRVQTENKGPVSPIVYARQLNHIENFLAQYGYSLRDPTFKDRDGVDTLGRVARLRPRNTPCTTLYVPSLKPVPPDWHIREQTRREIQWRANPIIRTWKTRRAYEPVRISTHLDRPSESLTRWWTSEGTDWFAIDWRNAQRNRRDTSRVGPMIASATMRRMLDPIVADVRGATQVHFTAPGGVGVTMPMSDDCGSGIIRVPLCEPEDRDNPLCKRSPGGVNDTETGGKMNVSTCSTKTGCLRKGDFLLGMSPWKSCIGQNGGFNGWFGAESCITIKSENEGHNGDFSLSDAVELSSGLTIFTFPLTLVEAQLVSTYTPTGGPSAPPAQLGGLLSTLGQSTTCCDPIEGPGATLPIGPLMLAISSRLLIHIDPAELNGTARNPPSGCPQGVEQILGIEGKATASSAAEFDAALTAYVAKAGISGQIEFTNDTLEGRIVTEADMGGNLLRVIPAMSYDMRRLDGSVSVFVEVDFFIRKERWSIELGSWNGYHRNQPLGDKLGEVSACLDPKAQCGPEF
jgi:hypothetical protein